MCRFDNVYLFLDKFIFEIWNIYIINIWVILHLHTQGKEHFILKPQDSLLLDWLEKHVYSSTNHYGQGNEIWWLVKFGKCAHPWTWRDRGGDLLHRPSLNKEWENSGPQRKIYSSQKQEIRRPSRQKACEYVGSGGEGVNPKVKVQSRKGHLWGWYFKTHWVLWMTCGN